MAALAQRRIVRPIRAVVRSLANLHSPAERFRHARVLHALRVALAMLTSIVVTTGIDIPHGVWASVSTLVVIGGLQHQGNIRQKAFERAVGTIIGAALGLAWVAQYSLFGSSALTYALMSLAAGVCGYYAVGKGGYIALLTAITMCIVAGHGGDSIEIGLWRTANVLIGIIIALVFSFALPLHATYSWRYDLALNLRKCAKLLDSLCAEGSHSAQSQSTTFADLGKRLVSLRALMPSVANECKVPLSALESIQQEHRALISALELLASSFSSTALAPPLGEREEFERKTYTVRAELLRIARRLRSAGSVPIEAPSLAHLPAQAGVAIHPTFWLLDQMLRQACRIAQLVEDSRIVDSMRAP